MLNTTTPIPTWLPVAVSAMALVLAAVSLGWNIYRDVVLRARVIVSVGVQDILRGDGSEPLEKVIVSAVNYGPGKIRLGSLITVKHASVWQQLFRRTKWFAVNPEWDSPYATKLPALLEVGEEVAIVFPYDEECFLGDPVTHVGMVDSFGRYHWAKTQNVREAKGQFRKDFQRVGSTWKRRPEPAA